MDLSIIIVPYKCKDQLDITLAAVYASKTSYTYEVFIIDNDSRDGTVEMVRQKYLSRPELAAKTTLLENTNEGFGRANNRGLKLAKGDYILLLNPDTKVAPENFQVMLDFVKTRPDVGIATCKLIKANGELDWACRRSEPNPAVSFYRLFGLQKLFPKSERFGAYNLTNKPIDQETEVDACTGAYMLIPREAYEKVGGFDEAFFMYGEDLDLCFRVRAAGYKVWYYPKTMSYHYKGQSSKKASVRSLRAFHHAMWIYYQKHYYHKYAKLISLAVFLAIKERMWRKLLINHFKKDKTISQ